MLAIEIGLCDVTVCPKPWYGPLGRAALKSQKGYLVKRRKVGSNVHYDLGLQENISFLDNLALSSRHASLVQKHHL